MDKRSGQPPGGQGDDKTQRPITSSDLLTLPAEQRRVMRIVLRHTTLSHAALCQEAESLPPEARPTSEALEAAIRALIARGWLITAEAEPAEGAGAQQATYRTGAIPRGVVAALSGHTPPPEPPAAAPDRRRRGLERLNNFWSAAGAAPDSSASERRPITERPPREHEPPRERPRTGSEPVGNLFKELAKPNTSLSDLGRDKPVLQQSGGGRISSLFDELKATPPPQPSDSPTADSDDES